VVALEPVEALRTALATRALRATSRLSRALRLGSGSTVGGRVGLFIDPNLLETLGRARRVALVTGTNGKTTTTRLLVEALGGPGAVASSGFGANMPAGLVSALANSPAGAPAVLEVDERYLEIAAHVLDPDVVVLLNLSRDQLDRMSEVRMVAARWRRALEDLDTTVVANADDPLVAYAAGQARRVVWVAAGSLWHEDAYHCPVCDSRITFGPPSIATASATWHCTCGFARPAPAASVVGEDLLLADGTSHHIEPSVPGRFNRANAAMAAMAAGTFGVAVDDALAAARRVSEVAGRFAVIVHRGRTVRLMLAKNPAGWTELLGLVEADRRPLVIGINARSADGHDPSWLWDVPFERIGDRFVVATGDRRLDLAVRLRHAGTRHVVEADPLRAVEIAGTGEVDYIGNYTAFQQMRRRLARRTRTAAPDRRATSTRAPAPAATPRPVVPPRVDASRLRVVVVHPDLLGTYGDFGNGRVLENRAGWRGIPVELIAAPSDVALPTGGDIYCLGGGEDGPQVRSAERLGDGALATAVGGGAAVLAVCAGFQIIGTVFPGADGRDHDGVGLVDAATVRSEERRAVGEVVAEPYRDDGWPVVLPTLSGFENHQARTRLGPGARPFARVTSGVGNGSGAVDGAVAGKVLGTYLHGPVLARNPALADLLIALATGRRLDALDDEEERALRAERLERGMACRRHNSR
jgi:CobQ-like glutamine amidotransferase family enzyme/UDP-N-acetylmuramyl tripeptide synthase